MKEGKTIYNCSYMYFLHSKIIKKNSIKIKIRLDELDNTPKKGSTCSTETNSTASS